MRKSHETLLPFSHTLSALIDNKRGDNKQRAAKVECGATLPDGWPTAAVSRVK